ncbi:type III secretion system needle filament subunit SctF [Proteus mirabilis]|uniref:type III secretion system needle filament subunit SctF n=1 Tax=Proteus mirabilis TaxID=584 RepID=UPI002349ABBB|nr:type III secretion system needle filament subunit SctF [Proteus mirabilis]MDC5886284.1 type III secretion system needle filament subunit SctF [Proteus mirabilis]MDC5903881.1 type III secretion system needle filament subunit SctF [Proteus mirabilis]MDC5907429.1 type III secretion system needle filament subunit SctF [Proteus mirabilis]MDC5921536.1 type III secretion system needle filament subunit SctF [Proteus mirabilis]MDC5932060.1 type III secretion system needle filament subunit SctF [Prot
MPADGSINKIHANFKDKAEAHGTALNDALTKLKADTSDAAALAEYQAKLSEYNITRSAQSGAIKAFKDIAQTIIGNMR